jgi:transcription initiation factor IIE alpha subunit
MNQQERADFVVMKQDVHLIKDALHLLMNNHVPHLQRAIEEASDKAEQAYGMASDAARESAMTRKFIVVAAAFISIFIAVIQCLGG